MKQKKKIFFIFYKNYFDLAILIAKSAFSSYQSSDEKYNSPK